MNTPNKFCREGCLFQSMISFVQAWECKDFIIFGDINAILCSGELWGRNAFDSASEELVSLVEDPELQDLPLLVSLFSFFSCGPSRSHSRLDLFLLSFDAGGWCHNVL